MNLYRGKLIKLCPQIAVCLEGLSHCSRAEEEAHADQACAKTMRQVFAATQCGEKKYKDVTAFLDSLPVEKLHCHYCYYKHFFGKEPPSPESRVTVWMTSQPFDICGVCSQVSDYNTLA